MPPQSFLNYVEEILDAIDRIKAVLIGVNIDKFTSDYRTRYSVLRSLKIIEKAVEHLPKEVKEKYADIPWKGIADLHEMMKNSTQRYNFETIWIAIKTGLPEIAPKIDQILIDFESVG